MYYKVSIVATGASFPQTYNLNYVHLSGKIAFNDFTSSIDVGASNLYTTMLAPIGSNIATFFELKSNGEFTWKAGALGSCVGTGGDVQLNFGSTFGKKEHPLFTIVVNAAPNDIIDMKEVSSFAQRCYSGSPCNSNVNIAYNAPNQSPLVTMPSPLLCAPSFQYQVQTNIPFGYLYFDIVPLNNSGKIISRHDGVIRITSSVPGMDYVMTAVQNIPNPPVVITKTKKNIDGSIDLYYIVELTPQSLSSPIFQIVPTNYYNGSYQSNFNFSFLYGRISDADGQVCATESPAQMGSAPGFPICDQNITMKISPYYDTGTNCQLGVKFTFSHNAPLPISVSGIDLDFRFILNPGNSIATPTTGLPCATCASFGINQGSKQAFYKYNQSSTFDLVSGTTIIVPFNLAKDCIHTLVASAELTLADGSTCAIWVPDAPRVCSPEVQGVVKLTNGKDAPLYQIELQRQTANGWEKINEELEFCKNGFSICEPPGSTPRRLVAKAHPETFISNGYSYKSCGAGNSEVTTWDLVYLAKHIAFKEYDPLTYTFVPPADWELTSPIQFLMGDVYKGNSAGITQMDITEIRKVILGIQHDFGSSPGVPSWYYLRHDYQFPSPLILNEVVDVVLHDPTANIGGIIPANGQGDYGKFAAIKTGDLSLSCDCGTYVKSSPRKGLGLQIREEAVKRVGNKLSIAVYAHNDYPMIAVQAGLRFNHAALSFSKVLPNRKARVESHHFGLTDTDKGIIRFGWSPERVIEPLAPDSHLFTLEFEIVNEAELVKGLTLWTSDKALDCYAYQTDGKEDRFVFDWAFGKAEGGKFEMQINPNPVTDSPRIYVRSTENRSDVALEFFDAAGRSLQVKKVDFVEGDNYFDLDTLQLPSGSYFLKVRSGKQIMQRPFVKL